jgi:hypothetical protein
LEISAVGNPLQLRSSLQRPNHHDASRAICPGYPLILSIPHAAAPVDFAREVLPIFQRSCFECHDAKLAKGKLRLDTRAEAFQKLGLVIPGKSSQSELVRRIVLPEGHEDVMPSRGEPLSKPQIELIRA